MPATAKRMSPGEKIDFYHRKMKDLTPERSPSEALLLEVMEGLIEHNRRIAERRRAGKDE
jgi:hypothetical protein